MDIRFLTIFLPISLLGLSLFCAIAILSLAPTFRAVNNVFENELNEVAANAGAAFESKLRGGLDLAESISGVVGVQISNSLQAQEQLLVPESIQEMLSTALDINRALVRFTILDHDGKPIAQVSNQSDRQGHSRPPLPIPWPPAAIEANKAMANLVSSRNTLQLVQVLPSYSPKVSVGFLYTEIDFTQWLVSGDLVLNGDEKSKLGDRRVTIKLRMGRSNIDQQIQQPSDYLPKATHKALLVKSLTSPMIGMELVVEASADVPAARVAAWHTVYLVLGMTFFAWSVIVWMIYFFRKRFVLPLKRMSSRLRNVIAFEESERHGLYNDSVSRLACLLDQLVADLDEAKNGKIKRLEETYGELYRTRARLEQIASSAGVVAISFCQQTGRILYRTSSVQEFFKFCGMTRMPDHPIGWRDLYRKVSRRQRGALKDCLRILRRDGSSKMQLMLAGVSCQRIYELRFRHHRVDKSGASRIDIIALDNTERALAEQARAASEERKTAIINVASDAYFSIASDGTILEVNPAAETLTGYSNLEMVGLSACGLIFSSTDFDRVKELWSSGRSFCGGMADYSMVIQCVTKSGIAVPVEVSGAMVASAGAEAYACIYLQDLRQRLSRDISLIRKGRELEEVFDLSPGGIAIFNENNLLVQINGRLKAILLDVGINPELGCTREHFWNSLCDKALPEMSRTLRLHLASGESAVSFKGASSLTLKYTERTLSDEHHANFSTVIYFNDITQEYQLDALKSGFLATAAHELRTPLAIILGFSELLSSEEYSVEERKSLSRSIYGNSLRLSALLNDLLDLTKIEASGAEDLNFDLVELTELLQSFLSNATVLNNGVLIYSGHPLKLENDNLREIKVRVDVVKIERVLHNLLNNAVKYSDIGSEIVISTRVDRQDLEEWAVLEITDHGVGMTSREVGYAFDRFWRADSHSGSVPGTGLGLAIAKEIMIHHGGDINIRSQTGFGTTVVLKIPLIASESVGLNQDALM
jgi:PAS domain S-box-containing protein